MKYMGGKHAIAKPLCYFLNQQLAPSQPFVDMFCGAVNIVIGINHKRDRYANDANPYLIALWQHVQNGGELPDVVTKEMYREIRLNKDDYPPWLVAFVGFGCSFGGAFFKGYARGLEYAIAAKNGCYAKRDGLKDVKLSCNSYANFEPPANALIYCDIPYRNTTGYKFGDFKHEEFYSWAHRMTEQGHSVFVSEYEQSIPEGWQVVWGRESVKGLRDSGGTQQKTREVLIAPSDLWVKSLLF
jgi:DNA adenine methylase